MSVPRIVVFNRFILCRIDPRSIQRAVVRVDLLWDGVWEGVSVIVVIFWNRDAPIHNPI
jgi:hypothetical protein